jgi:hypothetical protein
MPYYVDVRRYQYDSTKSNNVNVELLITTPRIRDTKLRTNTKYYVYYLIDIWFSNISTFSAWQTAVNNNVQGISGKGILVSRNTSTNEGSGLADGLTTNVTVDKGTNSNVDNGEVVNDNSHNRVRFNRKSGTTNKDVFASPTINVQWKSTASVNWTKLTNIYWRTTNNKQPSIIWTTVVTAPIFPLEAIKEVITTPTYEGTVTLGDKASPINITTYAWDKCTDLWNFVLDRTSKTYDQHWTCTLNGDQCKPSSSPSADDISTKAKLAAWTAKNVTNKMIAANSNAACNPTTTTSGNGLKNITDIAPPLGDTRWNPPTHRDARGIAHGERVIQPANSIYNEPVSFRNKERGRIYQDANSAETLNKNPDKLKDLVSAKGSGSNQWGFRFMYNPTTFGYQTSSNNSVDWTLGASDPATLLSGNSAVSFEVYINRIPDLQYLRLPNPKVPETQIYGRELTIDEKAGILNRGTEYDIEFLYRVLNGDPLSKSLLLNYDGVTSDFGYTTGVPCWLVLNENLRYYGSVASFSVNHAMFDLNMVPMLSTVSVTFARYPALWNETEAFGTGASVKSIKEYLGSTGKAPK